MRMRTKSSATDKMGKWIAFADRPTKSERLCKVCAEAATYIETTNRPMAAVKRNGDLVRDLEAHSFYYCSEHSGG